MLAGEDMSETFQLRNHSLIGFVGVRDAERAKQFYRDTLGLPLVAEELPFALVFDALLAGLRWRGFMIRMETR